MIQYGRYQLPLSQYPFSSLNSTELCAPRPPHPCGALGKVDTLPSVEGQANQEKNLRSPPINRGHSPRRWDWLRNDHGSFQPGLVCWGGTSGKDTFSVFLRVTRRGVSLLLQLWAQELLQSFCLHERSRPEDERTPQKSEQRWKETGLSCCFTPTLQSTPRAD